MYKNIFYDHQMAKNLPFYFKEHVYIFILDFSFYTLKFQFT